jgi:hypothetical protein
MLQVEGDTSFNLFDLIYYTLICKNMLKLSWLSVSGVSIKLRILLVFAVNISCRDLCCLNDLKENELIVSECGVKKAVNSGCFLTKRELLSTDEKKAFQNVRKAFYSATD